MSDGANRGRVLDRLIIIVKYPLGSLILNHSAKSHFTVGYMKKIIIYFSMISGSNIAVDVFWNIADNVYRYNNFHIEKNWTVLPAQVESCFDQFGYLQTGNNLDPESGLKGDIILYLACPLFTNYATSRLKELKDLSTGFDEKLYSLIEYHTNSFVQHDRQVYSFVWNHWQLIDLNNDGMVSRAEWKQLVISFTYIFLGWSV